MEEFKVNPLDHIGLVHTFASRYHRTSEPLEDSEVYSAAMLGLLKACAYFDPNQGQQFSTVAWRTMSFTLHWHWKYLKRQRRRRDSDIHSGASFASVSESEQLLRIRELREEIDHAVASLPERQRRLMELRLEGHTLEHCGELMGVSRQRAGQVQELAFANLRPDLCPQQ